MSELKPCPFCGNTDIGYSIKSTGPRGTRYHVALYCKKCNCYGARTLSDVMGEGYSGRMAAENSASLFHFATEAWNRRAQPANDPLTLEQLREMEWYEPVYVKFKHAIPSKVVSNLYDCLCYIGASESNYGKTWLAYRRPPEMFIGVDLASGHDFTAYGRPSERSENE